MLSLKPNVLNSLLAGFSLIELMVVLAIISLLTTLALPSYHHIRDRAAFLEVIQATLPYKLAVAGCVITHGSLTGCEAGQYGIPPPAHGTLHSHMGRIEVKSKGKIIAISRDLRPVQNKQPTYQLIPSLTSNGELLWELGGTCRKAGLC